MKNWIQQMLLWRKKTDKGRMTLGKVQKEYRENDVCMGELLDALPADGLSIEEPGKEPRDQRDAEEGEECG